MLIAWYVCSLYFHGDMLKHTKFQAICWDLLGLLLDVQLVGIFEKSCSHYVNLVAPKLPTHWSEIVFHPSLMNTERSLRLEGETPFSNHHFSRVYRLPMAFNSIINHTNRPNSRPKIMMTTTPKSSSPSSKQVVCRGCKLGTAASSPNKLAN